MGLQFFFTGPSAVNISLPQFVMNVVGIVTVTVTISAND